MKCPVCNKELVTILPIINGEKIDYCEKCALTFIENENALKNYKDYKMLEEDMKVWKDAQKYR